MSFNIVYSRDADEDLERLADFLLERDLGAAERAIEAIITAVEFLRDFPFACRKAEPDNSLIRELVIPFGSAGYVALFEIRDDSTVYILAIRHQREDDYH